MARDKSKNDLRRQQIREDFWPNATDWIWDPTSQIVVGFVGISRLMPWITTLIRHLSPSGDPSNVYWEFWCRHMGQGIVEVKDEEECAFAAGYTSNRALRTWGEHVKILTELRFIDTRQVGNRKIGYVLLPNPLAVARWHHEARRTPAGWWVSFKSRASEIGAEMPDAIVEGIFSDISAQPKRTVRKKKTEAQSEPEPSSK